MCQATGVYRKPIWHILEGKFELVLANAAHIRSRSGKDSIDHAPNGHDDLANAVAGAAAATRSKYRYDSSLEWVG